MADMRTGAAGLLTLHDLARGAPMEAGVGADLEDAVPGESQVFLGADLDDRAGRASVGVALKDQTTGVSVASDMPVEPISDVRLKRDIVLLNRPPNGLGVYRYRYKWSSTVYVGVMAQEVAELVPEAVVQGSDGYLRVNYARLGMRLMTWDQWVEAKAVEKARAAVPWPASVPLEAALVA